MKPTKQRTGHHFLTRRAQADEAEISRRLSNPLTYIERATERYKLHSRKAETWQEIMKGEKRDGYLSPSASLSAFVCVCAALRSPFLFHH